MEYKSLLHYSMQLWQSDAQPGQLQEEFQLVAMMMVENL